MFRKAERRIFPRFIIQTPQNVTANEGEIIDISLGGLSCRYQNDDGPRKIPLGNQFPLLAHLPLQTIDDFEIPHQGGKARLQRIKFGEVSGEQLNLLENFILDHSRAGR